MERKFAIVLSIGFVAVFSSVGLSAPPRFAPVDQLHHIHGLAVDPHDPTIVYIATHGGLVRLVEGQRWEHIGEGRSDLMGFTIHPSERGVMFVSGHPDHSACTGIGTRYPVIRRPFRRTGTIPRGGRM